MTSSTRRPFLPVDMEEADALEASSRRINEGITGPVMLPNDENVNALMHKESYGQMMPYLGTMTHTAAPRTTSSFFSKLWPIHSLLVIFPHHLFV
uniref:Uncharacterized protein n=1 Tax=Parascaris univalens TaxID=6257 RepID=A0A915B3K5_PARUN